MSCDVGAPKRVFIGLTLALAVVAAGPSEERQAARAQQGQGELFFLIQDASGTPVTDLTPEDFLVEQGGVECRVVSAELVGPSQLAILLDDSAGMTEYLTYVRDGMVQFADALPEGSEIAVITLSQRPTTLLDYTTDIARVKEQLGDYFVQRNDAATFFDAFVETVDDLHEDDALWPVIAAITSDGPEDSNSRNRALENMAQQLVEMGGTVHSLMLHSNVGQRYSLEPGQGLGGQPEFARRLTELTGGWSDSLTSPTEAVVGKLAEMGEVIAQRYAEMSNQYLVVFEPPANVDAAAGLSTGVRRSQLRSRVSVDGRPPPWTAELERLKHPLELALGEAALEGLDPEALEAEFIAADAAYNSEQWDQAVTRYRSLLSKLPMMNALHMNIGSALRQMKQYAEAIASYERARAGDPRLEPDVEAEIARTRTAEALEAEFIAADAAYDSQQWDQAVTRYRSLLSKLPMMNALHMNIGSALRQMEQYEEAIASYERARAGDPRLEPDVEAEIARTRMAMGDFEAASGALATVASGADASREDFYNLGELEFAKGDTDAAADWYEKAAANDPNWGKPLFKLALVALNKGDIESAKTFFLQVVEKDPSSEEAAQAQATLDTLP